MGFGNGLRVISLASIVALTGIGILTQPAPAAAADPSPSPATESPAPTASPTTDPSPTADTQSPAPTATVDPVPVASAAPSEIPVVSPDPALAAAVVVSTPAPAAPSLASKVIRIALAQRGKRYARGATGPRAFDCSGLVRYAFRKAGVGNRIGGGHSARGMLRWARAHHRASRSNLRVGDVVIYGNGRHAAIYIGRGRVINALNPRQGIRISGLHALRNPVTTYIHTHLSQ